MTIIYADRAPKFRQVTGAFGRRITEFATAVCEDGEVVIKKGTRWVPLAGGYDNTVGAPYLRGHFGDGQEVTILLPEEAGK